MESGIRLTEKLECFMAAKISDDREALMFCSGENFIIFLGLFNDCML